MFKYSISDGTFYIRSHDAIQPEVLSSLIDILKNFPTASDPHESVPHFEQHDFSDIPTDLLVIAANAYDLYGNTMLGVVCEYGKSVPAVKKMIRIGADLNIPDDNMSKTPIFWAVNNKLSSFNRDNIKALAVAQCLLDHGAQFDQHRYGYYKENVIEYSQSRGFTAAVKLFEKHNKHLEFCRKATKLDILLREHSFFSQREIQPNTLGNSETTSKII